MEASARVGSCCLQRCFPSLMRISNLTAFIGACRMPTAAAVLLSESVPHCVGIPQGRYRPEGVRPPEATTRQPNATSRRFDRLSQATIDGIMRASPRLVLRQRSRRARVAVIGAERFLTEIETTSRNTPATWHMSERQRTGIAGLSTITCARTTPSKMPQRSHCRSPALSCRLQIRRPPK